jgi:hypothetical protein
MLDEEHNIVLKEEIIMVVEETALEVFKQIGKVPKMVE